MNQWYHSICIIVLDFQQRKALAERVCKLFPRDRKARDEYMLNNVLINENCEIKITKGNGSEKTLLKTNIILAILIISLTIGIVIILIALKRYNNKQKDYVEKRVDISEHNSHLDGVQRCIYVKDPMSKDEVSLIHKCDIDMWCTNASNSQNNRHLCDTPAHHDALRRFLYEKGCQPIQ